MPSPVGHALGGVAAGWLVRPGRGAARSARALALAFAVLGMSPDLDLLAGTHRGPTHSVGAVLIVALASWLFLRGRRIDSAGRLAVALASAYGSHVLLDWLGADTSPPVGIVALWPWSSQYYECPWPVFLAVSRRFRQPELFWVPNMIALARELAILGPLAAAVVYLRRRPG